MSLYGIAHTVRDRMGWLWNFSWIKKEDVRSLMEEVRCKRADV
jgi:hypothetical protein